MGWKQDRASGRREAGGGRREVAMTVGMVGMLLLRCYIVAAIYRHIPFILISPVDGHPVDICEMAIWPALAS